MAKAAPLFLMEDDDAWLTIKAKLVLDGVQSLLEKLRADGFGSRRAERQGEQILASPRALADRLCFLQRPENRL